MLVDLHSLNMSRHIVMDHCSARRLFAAGPPLDSRLMGILTSHARQRPHSAAPGVGVGV